MTGFQLARISLSRRPFSTLLAILCMALACLAADLLVSIVRSQTSSLTNLNSNYDLIIGPKSGGTDLLLGALGLREPTDDIVPHQLTRYLNFVATPNHILSFYYLHSKQGHPIIGADENFWKRPDGLDQPLIVEGRVPSSTLELMVGIEASHNLGVQVGDSLSIESRQVETDAVDGNWTGQFEVVGLFECESGNFNKHLVIPIEAAWDEYRWKVDRSLAKELKNLEADTYIFISTVPEEMDFIESKIHEGSTVQVARVDEEIGFLRNLALAANRTSNLFCILIILLASMTAGILLNSRYDTIKPELGVMRALGYTRGELTVWLVFESIIPGALAVGTVVLLEWLLFESLQSLAGFNGVFSENRWPEVWNVLLWVLFLLVSLLAIAIPLVRLYRTDIRTAMEGV